MAVYWFLKRLIKKRNSIALYNTHEFIAQAEPIKLSHGSLPRIAFVTSNADHIRDFPRNSVPKYLRYLDHNELDYSVIDGRSPGWIFNCERFDIVILDPDGEINRLHNCLSQVYYLETIRGILCHPSYRELWTYEDKIHQWYLYKHYNIPHCQTFISYSFDETKRFLEISKYPLVYKTPLSSSSSQGVRKLRNREQATSICKKTFEKGYYDKISRSGHVNYVYLQEYIKNATFDLRVIVCGEKIFGYYRYANKGDFRASGSGIVEKRSLPVEAVRIAINVRDCFQATIIAVDMVSPDNGKSFLVIESSIKFGIDTCEQLVIDGVSGYYSLNPAEQLEFHPGKFWMQELAIDSVIQKWRSSY